MTSLKRKFMFRKLKKSEKILKICSTFFVWSNDQMGRYSTVGLNNSYMFISFVKFRWLKMTTLIDEITHGLSTQRPTHCTIKANSQCPR